MHEEEYQTWDVLTASLGQIQFSPSGRMVGIHINAALTICHARGYQADIVSVLLQEAEAAIIPIINSTVTNGSDDHPYLCDQVDS